MFFFIHYQVSPEETLAVPTNQTNSVFSQVVSVSVYFACITGAFDWLTWAVLSVSFARSLA